MKKAWVWVVSGCLLLTFAACKTEGGTGSGAAGGSSDPAVSEGIGGVDFLIQTESMYAMEITEVMDLFYGKYLNDDSYVEWRDGKKAEKATAAATAADPLTAVTEVTVVDYIRDFHIPRAEFEAMNTAVEDFRFYTDEQIDVLYSFDQARINREFAFSTAYMSDDGLTIYPMKWFFERPVSAWEAAGIRREGIQALEEAWLYAIGDAYKNAPLYDKVNSFLGRTVTSG